MPWFGNRHKQAKNFTPFKLKRKITKRTLALRVLAGLILLGGGLYYFFYATQAQAAWRDSAWAFRRKITIDHTKVVNTDQTNFPVLISLMDSDLKTNAQRSAYDIMFTSSDGTTKLDHEIEKYDYTDGELVAWVRIPTLSTSTDTVIYMYYGNSAAADQSNKTGVWDTSFKGIWHLSETSGSRSDSTSQGYSLADNGTGGVGGITGIADGANTFVSANSQYLSRSSASSTALQITGSITAEVWVRKSSFSISQTFMSKDGSSGSQSGWSIRNTTAGKAQCIFSSDGNLTTSVTSTGTMSTGTWNHVICQYDGTNLRVYVNGVSNATAFSTGIFNNNANFEIGARNNASGLLDGDADEARVSNVSRSSDWINTEYNNISSPSTFFSLGNKEQGTLSMYWKFDEGAGSTANDATINGYNGTLTNVTRYNEDSCLFQKCLYFNGSTSKVVGTYAEILDPSTNSFSLDLWFKHSPTISANQYLLTRYSTAGYKLYMNSSGNICFAIDDDSSWTPDDVTCTSATYKDSTWHHIKAIKTGTTSIALYIDGTQASINSSLTATGSLTGTSSVVNVGIDSDGSSNGWNGLIDEVKIYNGTRTAAQITADKNTNADGYGVATGSYIGSLTNGLLSYWKMDESAWTQDCSTSTVLDSSSNNYSGLSCPNTTGPTTSFTAKYYKSGSFDGTNDYVSVPGYSGLDGATAMSVSGWVNFNSAMTEKYIAWRLNQFDVRIGTNDMMFNISTSGGGTSLRVTPTVTDSAWHHVAYVYDGTKILMYLDKVLIGSRAVTGTISTGSNELQIGASNGSANFAGTIDEMRIYRRALNENEIQRLYDTGPLPVAQYNFDEGSATTAYDVTGSGNNGTLTNGPTRTLGKFGKAISFSGATDVVSLPTANIAAAGTVELWVYPDGNQSASKYVYASPHNVGNDRVYINFSGTLTIECRLSTPTNVGSATLVANTWNHVACAWNGTTAAFYVNGVNVTTGPTISAMVAPFTTSYIGGFNTVGGQNFKGSVDQLTIYNYDRTQKQIIADMNSNSSTITTSNSQSTTNAKATTPVGYWKFDEGNSTTANNSGSCGSSCNGTLTNMASPATSSSGWTSGGKFNKALVFDGTNDYVTVPANTALSPGTGSFSLSAWIKTSASPVGTKAIIRRDTNVTTTPTYTLNLNGSNYADFTIHDGTNQYSATGSTALNDGNWHHLAGVRNSQTAMIYLFVDGKQVAANTASATADITVNGTLEIGHDAFINQLFNGSIDEAKYYPIPLSKEEVSLDYNAGAANVYGATSTTSNGVTATTGQDREYCVPGDTTSCSTPVGEWKFDEGSGTSAADTTGNANTGTLNGSTVNRWPIGKIGKAGGFNGSTDYVNVGNGSSLGITSAITIEAWIYLNTTSQNNSASIVSKENGFTGYMLQMGTGANVNKIQMIVGNGSAYTGAPLSSSLSAGVWYHVTGTASANGTVKTYVNGISQGSTALSGSIASSTANVNIGRYPGNSQYFNGYIDQVRVFNYERTPAQVMWDYNRGNPFAWWKFDECTGSTLNDAGLNGYTGTVTIGASGTQTAVGDCNTSATAWNNGALGKYGSSLNFDGTDDYVDFGDMPITESATQLTWTGWIKPGTISSNKVIIGKGNGLAATEESWVLSTVSPNSLKFTFPTFTTDTNTSATVTNAISSSTWTHYAVVFDGSASGNSNRLKIFINGRLTNPTYVGTIPASTLATTSNVRAGSASDATGYFSGQLDELKIFNFPLTQAQVAIDYNQAAGLRFGP